MKTGWDKPRLQKLFGKYNRKFFGNRLSGYRVLPARLDVMGRCQWSKRFIEIDVDKHTSDRELRATLLHEMAHAASRSGHTVPFFAQLERLIRQGAPVTVSNAEAGKAKILSDVVPRQFPLLRTKMQHAEKRRVRALDKYVREKKIKTYTVTDNAILMQFQDAAIEVTWKQALRHVGLENGLADETGRPVNAHARRLLREAHKAFHSTRRDFLRDKKLFARKAAGG